MVVLTGLAQESSGLAAVAAGAQDYLIKGQSAPDAFGRAIRYATQRKNVELASAALQISALRAEENARLERGLLPVPMMRTTDFEVVARYRPGRVQSLLGGDFYDVVQTADSTVHAVIGDVAGHGAAEAAVGVCLRVAWRSLVLAGVPASRLIQLLEQMLIAERQSDQVFPTLTYLAFPADRERRPSCGPGTRGRCCARRAARIPRAGRRPRARAGAGGQLAAGRGEAAGRRRPGAVHGRAVRRPRRPRQHAAGRGRAAGHGPRTVRAAAAPFVDALIERAEAAASRYGGLADDVAVVHLGWKAA